MEVGNKRLILYTLELWQIILTQFLDLGVLKSQMQSGKVSSYNTGDIIYALATAWGKSAIAVVRISGQGCIEALSKVFSFPKKLQNTASNTAVYGHLVDIKKNLPVDDVVVTVYKDGHGYTGEEALEISCHGGLQVVKAVLALMPSLGFRQAVPGEFTLRAFLHGKMDLTQAEAVEELIDSQGRTGQTMALNRLNGSLFNAIEQIKDILLRIMSTIEVQLDYSEDEIGEDLSFPFEKLWQVLDEVKKIKSTFSTGRLYSQGAKVVLAGPSNAGKSSLFNYFLKEERSIVSSVKGTTRDFIEAQCSINGIPIRLYDTAGFRELNHFDNAKDVCKIQNDSANENQDDIEAEGMRRSKSLLDKADIIVYMIDAPSMDIVEKPGNTILDDPRCIVVESKIDLCKNGHSEKGSEKYKSIGLSVVTGEGFDVLCNEISRRLTSDVEQCGDEALVIESERQRENLARCYDALSAADLAAKNNLPLDIVSMDIQDALGSLGEITGEVTTDDILERIFGSFCVGK